MRKENPENRKCRFDESEDVLSLKFTDGDFRRILVICKKCGKISIYPENHTPKITKLSIMQRLKRKLIL